MMKKMLKGRRAMKLAPKHFRLLSILKDRGSVPAWVKPVVREELVTSGFIEHFHGDDWLREKDRYRLTYQGQALIDEYDEKVRQDKLRATCRTMQHGQRKKKYGET